MDSWYVSMKVMKAIEALSKLCATETQPACE